MDCLKDILCGNHALVGIRDFVNCPHPESILFVNDIPGITLKSASQIANEEVRSGYNLLNEKINLATKKVFNNFSGIISENFTFNTFLEAVEINEFSEEVNSPSNTERGLSLTRWHSEMARIYIEQVYIRVAESGIAILKIVDGDITKTYSVSLLANVNNVVSIRYKCESRNVKITFNQTNFSSYKCKQLNVNSCLPCGKNQSNGINKTMIVKGWDGSNETQTCFGLGVLANVQCFEENIICQLLPRMAFMMWYQAGIEILNEKIASERINAVTVFTKDQAKITLEELKKELKIEEKNFAKNINHFLKTTLGECVACNGSRYAYAKP
jgi:hypothetical protein